jgi:hypothetical protein
MTLSGEAQHVSEVAKVVEQMADMLELGLANSGDSGVEGPFEMLKAWVQKNLKKVVKTLVPAMLSTVEKAGWEVVSHSSTSRPQVRSCSYLFKPNGA